MPKENEKKNKKKTIVLFILFINNLCMEKSCPMLTWQIYLLNPGKNISLAREWTAVPHSNLILLETFQISIWMEINHLAFIHTNWHSVNRAENLYLAAGVHRRLSSSTTLQSQKVRFLTRERLTFPSSRKISTIQIIPLATKLPIYPFGHFN